MHEIKNIIDLSDFVDKAERGSILVIAPFNFS